MEAKKLDRLFKNGVQDSRDESVVDSWSKMKLMLDSEHAGARQSSIWKVAASLALLLVSAVVYYLVDSNRSQSFAGISDLNTAPMQAYVQEIIIPETTGSSSELAIAPIPKKLKKEAREITPSPEDLGSVFVSAAPEQFLEEQPEPIFPEQEVVMEDAKPKERRPVRITYKRSNRALPNSEMLAEAEPDTTKERKLKQFFEKNNLDPNEMWVDIRDTKDRLVQKAVDFKNKNVKNSKSNNK